MRAVEFEREGQEAGGRGASTAARKARLFIILYVPGSRDGAEGAHPPALSARPPASRRPCPRRSISPDPPPPATE